MTTIETIVRPASVPRISWRTKINPIWWFGNDPEPDAPEWLLPGKPEWFRQFWWHIRNPLNNFARYVVGVEDRAFIAWGPSPVNVPDWTEVSPDLYGWKWSVVEVGNIYLPYISYSRGSICFHIGWMAWSGRFALKFIRR